MSALATVENKILNVSSLVKKTDCNTKIGQIKLTAENFTARLKQANLASKSDIAKKFKFRINSNKTKHVLVENEFKKLQTFDSYFFIGQSYFFNDGVQLYLIF